MGRWSLGSPVTAWVTLGLVIPLYVVFYLLGLTRPEIEGFDPFSVSHAVWVGTFVAFTVVGGMVAARQPRNTIGWIFLATGVMSLPTYLSREYAIRSLLIERSLPWGEFAAWLSFWSWAPGMGLMVVALLLFPNGMPPSPRWRWVLWLAGAPILLITVVGAVGAWGLRGPLLLSDPNEIATVPALVRNVILLFPLVLVAALLAMSSLVVRYRRANGVERQQLKWVALAASIMGTGLIAGETFAREGMVQEIAGVIGTPIWFPIAAGIAILRYRLYDIDRIISRTVTYAVVVGLLGAVVLGLVAALALFLPSDDPLVVAVATLAVFALFNPVRRRVQVWVDRRFNRSRYDAARVIDDFTGSLQDRVDPEGVVDDWVGVVETTMQPTTVGVWVRE